MFYLLSYNSTLTRKQAFIDDDLSKEIFGDEQLAELNEALRELEGLQFNVNTGIFVHTIDFSTNDSLYL